MRPATVSMLGSTTTPLSRDRANPGSLERQRADVVHLAELDAVVAEDRVRGDGVEVEVGARHLDEVVAALDRLALEERQADGARLGALEVLRRAGPEVRDDGLDPRVELLDGGL